MESTPSSCCQARKTSCFHRSGIPPCFPKRLPVNNGIYVHLSKLYVLLRYYVHFKQKITLYSTNLLYFYLYKKKNLYLTCNFYSWLNRLKNVSTKIPYMILFLKKNKVKIRKEYYNSCLYLAFSIRLAKKIVIHAHSWQNITSVRL